jgi:hypothetical protein
LQLSFCEIRAIQLHKESRVRERAIDDLCDKSETSIEHTMSSSPSSSSLNQVEVAPSKQGMIHIKRKRDHVPVDYFVVEPAPKRVPQWKQLQNIMVAMSVSDKPIAEEQQRNGTATESTSSASELSLKNATTSTADQLDSDIRPSEIKTGVWLCV